MPELPEVETIVRYLRPQICGKRIWDIEVRGRRVLRDYQSPQEFVSLIKGRRIKSIGRFGKNIIFELAGGTCFAIHLMMTGRWFLDPAEETPYDRLIFRLSGGRRMVFNDIRQFGRCRLIAFGENNEEGRKFRFPKLNLGPDASTLTLKEFSNQLSGRKGAIKSILLNQKIIAGIGNIYSDEILWYAGIKPTRKLELISEKETRLLYAALKKVLRLAIKKEGTSARDYLKPDGSRGGYYEIRRVYQRQGERCVLDGAIIKKIKLGSRSAYFCPRHQR